MPSTSRYPRVAPVLSLLALFFWMTHSAVSQAYFVSQPPGAYEYEWSSPNDVTVQIDSYAEIPIGFSFNFFGENYTHCYVAQNGFIQFGSNPDGGCCQGQFLPSPSGPNNLIAAAWMNNVYSGYCCIGGESYTVYQYETLGDAPNRRLVISLYGYDDCSDEYSGQIKLFEGSDIIEIHTETWAENYAPCANVTQGIENSDGTEAYYIVGRNANTTWKVNSSEVVRFTPPYALPQRDAGVSYIFNLPACEGSQPIDVLVSNFGAIPLDSVVIDWSWEDVLQDSLLVIFNPPIVHGESRVIEIGSQNFVFGEQYDIRAWTKWPNGVTDDFFANDTSMTQLKTGVRDTFTIGGTDPDFATFGEAIAFLQTNGVCDTTWMLVRPGTYTEQVEIPWIDGASNSRVIFSAENGDSSSVILQFDPTITKKYVLLFYNATGITWERMTLNALGTDYTRVIQLSNHSFNNTIQHCAITGYNTTFSSSNYACIYSHTTNPDNIIQYNTIKNGSVGVKVELRTETVIFGFDQTESRSMQRAAFDDNYSARVQILNNTIQDFSYAGVSSNKTKALQIHRNQITSAKNQVYGLETFDDTDTLSISNNVIGLSSGNSGIYIFRVIPSQGRASMFNNMVYAHHATNAVQAIVAEELMQFDMYHNTFKVKSPHSSSRAMTWYYGFQDSVYNNIFATYGGGTAIYLGEAELSAIDYNTFYYESNLFGTANYNTSVYNLEEYRNVTGFDQNSQVLQPLFFSETDLHTRNGYLNGTGSPILSTLYDIDGEVRNSLRPDPGADEFTPESRDASVQAMLSPKLDCDTLQDIEIVLINLGTDTLTAATIEWTRNGTPQTPHMYTGQILPEGDTAHIILEALATFSGQPDTLRFIATELNGADDQFMANDTLVEIYSLPLQGMYTVGGTSPDFSTIQSTIDAMASFGICGPTTFLLRNGIYNEQVSIRPVQGASEDNTITYSSESGDSSTVSIQYNSTSQANYIVRLEGAKYIRFEHLGFKTLNTTYANIIHLIKDASHLKVLNCYLEGRSPTFSSGSSFHIQTDDTHQGHIELRNNYFFNSTRSVSFNGSFAQSQKPTSFIVEGNQFVNQRAGAVYAQQVQDIVMDHNIVTANTAALYTGIGFSFVHGQNRISYNKVNLLNVGDGILVNNANNQSQDGGVSWVFNNMSSVVSGSAFSMSGNRRLRFHFNTGYSSGTTASSHHAIKLSGGDSITVQNNIGVANAGRAYSEGSFIPVVHSDYNNFYTSGSHLAYRANTPYTDLIAWQNGTSLDSHSVSVDPIFLSTADLHVLSPVLNGAAIPIAGITTDFDQQLRHLTTPDIGADEIGTDENDAGVMAIQPVMPFAYGQQDVKVIIRNYGSNALQNVDIHWKVNGAEQTVFQYVGNLQSLQQDTIILGQYEFTFSTPYTLQAWTDMPNMVPDVLASNDTITTGPLYAAVTGILTIGGSSPDFTTVSDAISAMSLGGVVDSVNFLIRTGTYTGLFNIPHLSMLSCSIPVIFESESGNPADVIWTNTALTGPTLTLDGADGVTFRNLTIQTVVTLQRAIVIQNGSNCNTFEGCKLNGVSTSGTATTQAIVFSGGGVDQDNTFRNNTFHQGTYGMYLLGTNASNLESGTRIEDNTFTNQHYRAIHLQHQNSPLIQNNNIKTTSAPSTSYAGIVLSTCQNQLVVSGNKIEAERGSGLQISSCTGTSPLRGRIYNNMVNIVNAAATVSYGIDMTSCAYQQIHYNTVRANGTNAGTRGLRISTGNSNMEILNNIFYMPAAGMAMLFSNSTFVTTCNYNDLLKTTGPTLVQSGATPYATLAAWQATGFDLNSISEDPEFVSALDLHVTSSFLDGAATPIAYITHDIDGDLRNTLEPDIGADEINLFTDDVGLLAINYPLQPFMSGVNTVFIKFINNGADTLTSMQVDWEVDGIMQPTYMWTGLLPSAGTYDSLDIGEFDFAPYQTHDIKVWVSQPNGMTDGLASNDTLFLDNLYPGLAGVYTIGGDNPDFDSLQTAVGHLNLGGAAGPVTFNIRSGTYLEPVSISDFPGSDCGRPVIFQSESGNSADVTITNLGINAHTIVLDGADGVIFQNLSIESVNTSFRHVVSYFNGAHCNQFLNNTITGFESTSTASSSAVIISASGLDTANIFHNNHIRHGSYSFYIDGAAGAYSNTQITNNHLDLPRHYGIYAEDNHGIRIHKNLITTGASTTGRGISLSACHNGLEVSENKIYVTSGPHGIRFDNCDGTVSSKGIIVNNFVSVGGAGSAYGIYLSGSNHNQVFHNNVQIYSTTTSGTNNAAFYFTSNTSISVRNNIMSNASPGYAIYANANPSYTGDFNNLFATGAITGHWDGTLCPDLAAWQMASSHDQNSLGINPQYMSNTDLHVSNILLNSAGEWLAEVTHDIDGDLRSDPCDIGADEFDPSIPNDAGVFVALGPIVPFAHGNQPVTVAVKNFGADTLTSVKVRWVVNGIEQPLYQWTGMLPPAQCDTVIIGTYGFAQYTEHDLIFWTELPNLVPDSTNINDTLRVHDLYPALVGTYTVGGVLPDFNLFSQLERALDLGGILGPVTFSIRNGTYASQLTIKDFPRLSYGHHVTFTAAGGDSSLVILTRNFNASSSNNFTVRLNNAHGIRFENVTLASTKGRVLELTNGTSDIQIENCRFTGVQVTNTTASFQLIYSGTTSEDSITITHNLFEYGDQGIYMIGSTGDYEQAITINHNTFYNCYTRAIYARYHTGLQVQGNTILNNNNSHQGMALLNGLGSPNIIGNDIRLLKGGANGMSLFQLHGTAMQPVMIHNNYILARNGGTVTTHGIYQETMNHVSYNYNTIRIENTGASSTAFTDNNSHQNIHFRNCSFSNYSGGRAVNVPWSLFSGNTMNYCNLYASGAVLAYYNGSYADMVALQAGTNQNQNSVSAEPLFGDDSPLVFQAEMDGTGVPVAGITTDIVGEPRDGTMPDIGAKEFTLPAHDIGAKLLVDPATYCGLSDAEDVTIRIQNYGANTETGFDVAYSMNGAPWIVENVGALTILPGKTLDYTFSIPENMEVPGDYIFEIYTSLPTDLNLSNDTLRGIVVQHIPALTMPVSNMIPVDGTMDLEKTVSLSWVPAENATKYDVYIWQDGSSQPGTPQVANLTQINTLYSQLNYGTLYNWQVVAKNICDNMVPGPIQQFSVRQLPDLVVDTIIAPPTAFSGQQIEIEWKVKNIGTGSTNSTLWSDAVYLSADATLNTSYDIYLGAVQNLTSLNPGITYTNTGSFTIPNGTVGNYYVFVYPDRWKNLIESNENNNWDRTPTQMMISLTPAPDLIVMSVTTPTTVFSGTTIPVTYVVKNNGSGSVPVNSLWKDRLIFGEDPFNAIGTNLNIIQRSGLLEPDSTYEVTVMAAIPPAILGTYYMHVRTDYLNEVYEFAAEGNNTGASLPIDVILTPPPDLVVASMNFPDTVSNNEIFQLAWTVENQGAGDATGTYWLDQVYLSKSPIYNTNFLIPLTNKYYYATLPALSSYTVSHPTKMLNTLSGDYFVYIYTDQKLKLFEYNMEGNNILRSMGTIHIQKGDLLPANPTRPDTVEAGASFTLSWNRINQGPGRIVDQNNRTKIFVSTTNTLDANAVLIQNTTKRIINMSAQDTLPESVALSIPPQFSQHIYILIQEDADNIILESVEGESNNVLAVPIFASPGPVPDIKTMWVSVADTIVAGSIFNVAFQIKNQGTQAAFTSWQDRVYISFDSIWMPAFATELTTITQTSPFQADQTRDFNPGLLLNSGTAENVYYIYIVNDINSNVYEGVAGELNNIIRSAPVYVKPAPAIDLRMDTVHTEASMFASGQSYSFHWTVINDASIPIQTTIWADQVFLSTDPILSANDIFVEQIASSGSTLLPGGSRSKSKSIRLPNGVSGDYYILFVADSEDVQQDPNRLNNVNTLRDVNGDPMMINIALSPSPDLVVTVLNTPAQAVAGQPMNVIYTITNSGNSSATSWRDKLFLSTDQVLSNNDILLFSKNVNHTLAPSAERTDTVQVVIPAIALGNYILILQTDSQNAIYEHNGENNNILNRAVEIVTTPPADLIVSTVNIPVSIIAGENITISWTTDNIGANPASGIFREVVYISTDTIWDTDDVVFGLKDGSIYLSPGSSRGTNLTSNVVGVATGDYYAIVQTDARQNFIESNEDNNFTSSPEPMNIDVKTLVLDSLTADTLFDQLELYYKLIIGAELDGETIILELIGDSLYGLNELFVKYEQMPTRAEFDYGFDNPFHAHQRILIPDVEPGTYYIMAYGTSVTESFQEITLLASVIDYEILSVQPNKGTRNTQVTLKVKGAKLMNTVTARLRQSNPWFERVASSILQVNDNLMYITFDLTDVPEDIYALDLIKADSSLAFTNDFMVLDDGGNADLQINAQLPGNVPERPVSVHIVVTYINNGDADYVNPSATIEAPYGNRIAFTLEELRNGLGESELVVPLIEENGPANLLRPGASGRIELFGWSAPRAVFGIRKND